jgi:hypothetical protein
MGEWSKDFAGEGSQKPCVVCCIEKCEAGKDRAEEWINVDSAVGGKRRVAVQARFAVVPGEAEAVGKR